MNEHASAPDYQRQRFPPAISAHAVWLYCRFALRYRDVEEVLAQRGVQVTGETVRRWCRKCGQTDANGRRRRRARPGDTGHLDEVFVSIKGDVSEMGRQVLGRDVEGCRGMSRDVEGCRGMSRDVEGCRGMSRDVEDSVTPVRLAIKRRPTRP